MVETLVPQELFMISLARTSAISRVLLGFHGHLDEGHNGPGGVS